LEKKNYKISFCNEDGEITSAIYSDAPVKSVEFKGKETIVTFGQKEEPPKDNEGFSPGD